jgi:hypothetical protein
MLAEGRQTLPAALLASSRRLGKPARGGLERELTYTSQRLRATMATDIVINKQNQFEEAQVFRILLGR